MFSVVANYLLENHFEFDIQSVIDYKHRSNDQKIELAKKIYLDYCGEHWRVPTCDELTKQVQRLFDLEKISLIPNTQSNEELLKHQGEKLKYIKELMKKPSAKGL